jgi:uncharacterized membrane protein YeaQ/YmgE (transglycosylase-associated protein family)
MQPTQARSLAGREGADAARDCHSGDFCLTPPIAAIGYFGVCSSTMLGPRFAIRENIMNIILFLVFGLVVGFIARAVMPGSQKMSMLATMLLGVVGSFIGGFVAALLTQTRVLDFNTTGLIGSVIGSLIALAIAGGAFTRGRATI